MKRNVQCFWLEPIDESRYRRSDTGEEILLKDAPPGAMWNAHWMSEKERINGNGIVLVVRMPNGGDWMPGSESRNCTRKGEDHDCWCIHGTIPNLTADKNPEPGRSTCQAGAGSIQHGNWHGFLRNGILEEV